MPRTKSSSETTVDKSVHLKSSSHVDADSHAKPRQSSSLTDENRLNKEYAFNLIKFNESLFLINTLK